MFYSKKVFNLRLYWYPIIFFFILRYLRNIECLLIGKAFISSYKQDILQKEPKYHKIIQLKSILFGIIVYIKVKSLQKSEKEWKLDAQITIWKYYNLRNDKIFSIKGLLLM